MGKNHFDWIKEIELSRRWKLSWDRFIEMEWIPRLILAIPILLICLLLLFGGIIYLSTLDQDTFLKVIIPIILVVQVLFLVIQVFCQMSSNKYQMVGCLPILNIRTVEPEHPRSTKRNKKLTGTIQIHLVNNGLDADNISFKIKINKSKIDTDLPLFNLEKGNHQILHTMKRKEFYESGINIRVTFEGILHPLRFARFKKDKDESNFRIVTRGL